MKFRKLALIIMLFTYHVFSMPLRFGDIDGDGMATTSDVTILSNHLSGKEMLSAELEPFADANRDNVINTNDIEFIVDVILGLASLPIVPDIAVGFSSRVCIQNVSDK